MHTIANASANQTGQREHAIEYTVCRVGQRDILSSSSTEIGHGTEHSRGGKANLARSANVGFCDDICDRPCYANEHDLTGGRLVPSRELHGSCGH
jgi:hypothetical protein